MTLLDKELSRTQCGELWDVIDQKVLPVICPKCKSSCWDRAEKMLVLTEYPSNAYTNG